MPKTFVRESTLELRANLDAWLRDFEEEYRRQATKINRASETRMRVLLRQFAKRVYIPYRDATLNRTAKSERDEYFEDEREKANGELQENNEESTVYIMVDDDVDLDDLPWETSDSRVVYGSPS